MRRLMALLSVTALLAACGGGDDPGDEDQPIGGAATDEVSAESVSELAILQEAVGNKCDDEPAPRLEAAVDKALEIASFNPPDSIVAFNDQTQPRNFDDFLERMATFLERCAEPELADRLRNAEFGTDEG